MGKKLLYVRWGYNLLQSGDSSAPLGQLGVLSHTVVRLIQTLWPGHCHCQLGHRKGGVGQSLSSLMSLQSLSPSQIQLSKTQFPLSQRKREDGQVRGGQAWCSSLPSWQSGWPSHSHDDGIQLPSDWHWNSFSWWHIPGGLVAKTNQDTQQRYGSKLFGSKISNIGANFRQDVQVMAFKMIGTGVPGQKSTLLPEVGSLAVFV